MQLSSTFNYLLKYLTRKENHIPSQVEFFHQSILRLIQVISSVKNNCGQKVLILSILDTLAKISNAIAKRNFVLPLQLLREIIEYLLDIEQEEFRRYYPKIKKLYMFLISNIRPPNPSELKNMEIELFELGIICRLLFLFYNEGEPQFVSSDADISNFLQTQNKIRGRSLSQIVEEIRMKYCETDKANFISLYYPHLIIDAGYNFRESIILADELKKQGVVIYQQLIEDENLVNIFREIVNMAKNSSDFIALDWIFSIPSHITDTIQFCAHCGVPLSESKIDSKGEEIVSQCEICRGIS